MTQVPALKTQRMQVGGMDCTSCAMKIEGAVEQLAGVAEISVVVATGRLVVTYDPARVSEADIKQRVTALGYTIDAEQSKFPAQQSSHDHSSHDDGDEDDHSNHDHSSHGDEDDHAHNHGGGGFNLKREGLLIAVVIALFIFGSVFEKQLNATPFSIGSYLVFIPAYLLSGWTVLTSAGRNILRGQVFDENFLMTIATVGAIAIKQLPEAVGVMLFFKVGELFQ
jgi:Zn2+/Cd2+-exporting ATPase